MANGTHVIPCRQTLNFSLTCHRNGRKLHIGLLEQSHCVITGQSALPVNQLEDVTVPCVVMTAQSSTTGKTKAD